MSPTVPEYAEADFHREWIPSPDRKKFLHSGLCSVLFEKMTGCRHFTAGKRKIPFKENTGRTPAKPFPQSYIFRKFRQSGKILLQIPDTFTDIRSILLQGCCVKIIFQFPELFR
jgi:hypothetical protein